MLRTTFNRHLNFPMHACEIIVTYHIISWISFTYTQEWFEQHSDTGISIEFHQLQKQIAWLQCGCFVLLWPTRKSQALNWNYLSLYQSAFYYKQDKKGKQTWLKEKPARGHHRGWDPNESRHYLWSFPEEKQKLFSDLLCVTTANHLTSYCAELSHRWYLEHIPCIIQHLSWRGNTSNH